jgi:tyrosinase
MLKALAVGTLALGAAAFPQSGQKALRKDWNKMSTGERHAFTDAVNALKMNKAMLDMNYDTLVLQHRTAYRTPAPWAENPAGPEEPDMFYRNGDQKGPAFLPWHRQQLMVYEKALQEVSGDPSMGVPYWNYMIDAFAPEPMHTALWTADAGIGGNGRPADQVVADGPFAM